MFTPLSGFLHDFGLALAALARQTWRRTRSSNFCKCNVVVVVVLAVTAMSLHGNHSFNIACTSFLSQWSTIPVSGSQWPTEQQWHSASSMLKLRICLCKLWKSRAMKAMAVIGTN